MTKLNLFCQGCVVKPDFPNMCGCCSNLSGNYHKYNSLLKNYEILMNIINCDEGNVCNKSKLNKIFKK